MAYIYDDFGPRNYNILSKKSDHTPQKKILLKNGKYSSSQIYIYFL